MGPCPPTACTRQRNGTHHTLSLQASMYEHMVLDLSLQYPPTGGKADIFLKMGGSAPTHQFSQHVLSARVVCLCLHEFVCVRGTRLIQTPSDWSDSSETSQVPGYVTTSAFCTSWTSGTEVQDVQTKKRPSSNQLRGRFGRHFKSSSPKPIPHSIPHLTVIAQTLPGLPFPAGPRWWRRSGTWTATHPPHRALPHRLLQRVQFLSAGPDHLTPSLKTCQRFVYFFDRSEHKQSFFYLYFFYHF